MKSKSIEITVPFADVDGMRAVYHANYIVWFDMVRTKLYQENGIAMEKWEEGGILLPLVVCHCEYKESARFDDKVKVTATITEVKGKVITIEYEIENMETHRIITTGLTKQVFVDENGKSFVLEERYPEIYQNLIS